MPLPSNIYSGGAVTFNATPFTQFYLQNQYRQQARREAVDNYYRELGKNLTSEGMDNLDVPKFVDKVNQWKQYVTSNRQALSNPNHPEYAKAATQASYLYNDAMGYSSQSKDKVKDIAGAREFLNHPDYPLTDASLHSIHTGSLALDDPNFKPLDVSTIQFGEKKPKPVTAADWEKWIDVGGHGLTMSEGKPSIQVDPKTRSVVSTTKSSFDVPQLQTIHDRYVGLYNSDRNFHDEMNKLMQDEGTWNAAAEKFRGVFKHDMQYPEEFAVAYMLPQLEKTNTQRSPYSNPWEQAAIWDYKQKQQTQYNNAAITAMVDDQVNEATKNAPQSMFGVAPIPVDPATLNSMNASRIVYDPQTKIFTPQIDVTDPKTGEVTGFVTGTPMTREQWESALGKRNIGQSYFRQPSTSTQTQSQGSSKKTYNYNGKSYTQDQIEKGAKHYGMSVDEYLKQLGIK